MSYLANYDRGLGFENTFSDAPVVAGPFDVSGWDWHEWALAGLAAYMVAKTIFGGVKRNVVAPIKKSRKRAQRRRETLARHAQELESI